MTLILRFSNTAGAASIALPCATTRARLPGFALRPTRIVLRYSASFTGNIGKQHRSILFLFSRFSASEHRNALTLSLEGSAKDCARRPQHTDVLSGDRKGKAAKRRIRELIGWPSFWILFLGHARKSISSGRAKNIFQRIARKNLRISK